MLNYLTVAQTLAMSEMHHENPDDFMRPYLAITPSVAPAYRPHPLQPLPPHPPHLPPRLTSDRPIAHHII